MAGAINIRTGLPFAPSWPRIRENHPSPYITLGEGKVDAQAASPQTFGRARGRTLGAYGLAFGGKLTAKSYVQNGLVLQWDAIENVGYGEHDATATTWKDLVGTNNMKLTMGSGYWNDNSLHAAQSTATKGTFTANTTFKFVEVAMKELSSTLLYQRHIVFCFGDKNHYFMVANKYSVLNGIEYASGSAYNGLHPLSSFANTVICAGIGYGDDNTADTTSLYYNGVNETPTGGNLAVGNGVGMQTYGSYQADSEIYSVRLYSRQLTAAEVAANYAIDKARFGLS